MSVRYKFTNDLQYSTLPCDGFDVSLRDLKKAVVRAKKIRANHGIRSNSNERTDISSI